MQRKLTETSPSRLNHYRTRHPFDRAQSHTPLFAALNGGDEPLRQYRLTLCDSAHVAA